MAFLSKDTVEQALHRLKNFHDKLRSFYEENGMEFLEDIGRRNILLSKPQEKFFAQELSKLYPQTISDGKTGEPDIILPDLGKELECKITSPHKSGAWSLQTDYATLKKKGSLDYLYVLGDREFENFAVFHFENLTIDDFRKPSPGSRGKSAIILRNAIKKCNILWGGIENRNEKFLKDIENKINNKDNSQLEYFKLKKRKNYWKRAPLSFSFLLSPLKKSNGLQIPMFCKGT